VSSPISRKHPTHRDFDQSVRGRVPPFELLDPGVKFVEPFHRGREIARSGTVVAQASVYAVASSW
jgi:hypothetical protein